jgi:hypothetical protein
MALKIIGVVNDANSVLPVRELDLNRLEGIRAAGKSSERQARDTTGLGVYSCRPDLPFVKAF